MKEIKITRGLVVLVDDEDFEWLNQWNWYTLKAKQTFYAYRHSKISDKCGTGFCFYMHREILKAPKDIQVDHRNGDGLQNTRENLRSCTHAQNCMNKRKGLNFSSIYKGVSWRKDTEKWDAKIQFNKKTIHLGPSFSEIEAARRYDVAAIQYFGEFALLNFDH